MSITIAAVPFMLLAGVISATTAGASVLVSSASDKNNNQILRDAVKHGEKLHIQKEYETIFVDKDLLTKTLIEHGVEELSFVGNYIVCNIGEYVLRFSQEGEKPYKLEVMCDQLNAKDCDYTIDTVVNEYTQNVQEATYLKIKERLEKNNLEIAQEDILEDNSIMLTINL